MGKFEVRERYVYQITYTLEADTWEEAKRKVEQGDGIGLMDGVEEPIGPHDVVWVGNADTGDALWQESAAPNPAEHGLVIDSLRDLKAHCTCGRWELSATTSNRETEAYLHDLAEQEWRLHSGSQP